MLTEDEWAKLELRKKKQAAASKAWYEANKEKAKAQRKAWREANKEKDAERQKLYRKFWYEANKERVLAKAKEYREANKEKIAAKLNERREEISERRRQLRFRKKPIINYLLVSQRGLCAVCHTDLIEKHHLDHIVPIVKGGTNDRSNFRLLCPSCNLSKSAKDPVAFMQERGKLL